MRLPALTGPLRSWLLEEPSDDVAIGVIAKSDLLRGQASMMLPELRQEALRPASPADIMGILRSREQTFGDLRTERTEAEWAAFFADYFEALNGLTASQIEAGMVAYIALPDSEWSPKPGKLAHLAKTTPSTGRFTRAYNRARAAVVASQPAVPKPEEPRPSAEEVQVMMANFHRAMADKDPFAKLKAKARQPTPSAKVDDTGVSAEMRALWARQRAA
ncbi:hypothetical protein E4M02_11075 [Brevundimonas sp. S30B]|uniref:hypothetical protein n=1 Tax=unclassified Brevundimonas TaxID=2622653 RepID=UPI001072E24C|nr:MULTISPECIES: hypothetical protein [unclassified Brevundimonas]QBX38656.1 hypothetical protein E4M01_13335 [Brevundimonas sp. MF30-B]TFW01247.1 hypothetical protein E4M02_11075 [Brevundimonas sp. S30B]